VEAVAAIAEEVAGAEVVLVVADLEAAGVGLAVLVEEVRVAGARAEVGRRTQSSRYL
jgi:hypothetical protein